MKRIGCVLAVLLLVLCGTARAVSPEAVEALYEDFTQYFADAYGVEAEADVLAESEARLSGMTALVLELLGLEPGADALADWAAVVNRIDGAQLRQGDRGAQVVAMQKALLAWDPDALPGYGADGSFGRQGAAAVAAFQEAAGLEPTGVYDATTRVALECFDWDDTPGALMFYAAETLNERLLDGAFDEILGGTLEAYAEPDNDPLILVSCRFDLATLVARELAMPEAQAGLR